VRNSARRPAAADRLARVVPPNRPAPLDRPDQAAPAGANRPGLAAHTETGAAGQWFRPAGKGPRRRDRQSCTCLVSTDPAARRGQPGCNPPPGRTDRSRGKPGKKRPGTGLAAGTGQQQHRAHQNRRCRAGPNQADPARWQRARRTGPLAGTGGTHRRRCQNRPPLRPARAARNGRKSLAGPTGPAGRTDWVPRHAARALLCPAPRPGWPHRLRLLMARTLTNPCRQKPQRRRSPLHSAQGQGPCRQHAAWQSSLARAPRPPRLACRCQTSAARFAARCPYRRRPRSSPNLPSAGKGCPCSRRHKTRTGGSLGDSHGISNAMEAECARSSSLSPEARMCWR
jgi:hypothetical protein